MMPFLFFLFATAENPEWVQIQLSFDRAANHLIEVVAEYPPANTSQRTLNMPVWTPGSYKIRDYARNVQGFEATSLEGNPLQWTKTEKSAWQIRVPIQTGFRVRYQIYAFEESVRTNFVNSEGGYVNPAATFMYEKGAKRSYRILFKTPKTWQVHSGLSSLAPNLFEARSLDSLMDCPYLLGPTTLLQFTVRSIPFRFAYLGQPNVDMPKLLGDIQKIAQETVDLFGSAPFQNYIFLCVFRNGPARGGLEHRNSTLFLSESNRFLNEKGRTGFLSLVAHELFHAWNVKAMRDEGIWNFDYQTENYTRLLWVHEGWTSYYDDLILVRTGLMDVKKWWEKQAKTIQSLEESAAPKVESLTDASFDAWIHNYQPNGNAHNAQVDYYDQGALSALALDLYLRSVRKTS